jgi:Stress responsive A/B Barrel Domain
MLIHIVCWKYKAETDANARKEHIERLRALPGIIDNIEGFDVGADVLHLDRSFDTGLVAMFPGREALDHYNDHPEHQAVAAMGRQIAEKVISVDFFRAE